MTERCFELDVLHADGRYEHVRVYGSRLLVGSGAHCEVHVGDVWTAREQILLELAGTEVVAHSRSTQSPPLADALPFGQLKVHPDTVLSACGTQLRVRSVPIARPKAPRRWQLGPVIALALGLAFTLLPALAYLALRAADSGPPPTRVSLLEPSRAAPSIL
jgi:hypothetical protein